MPVFICCGLEQLDDIDISDLMNFVKGPDFPTGGILLEGGEQSELLLRMLRDEAGSKCAVVSMWRNGSRPNRIIITELPYQTNKTNLIEKIADLARNEVLEGVSDLRDESDRHGMRIVLELSKSSDMDSVLRKLYRSTPLESTFGMALLALVDDEPRLLTLKQALHVYLEHRTIVVRREVNTRGNG
jgi:DNA gyrase subunit A